MTTDELTRNKQIVDAFIQELFSKGDLEAVDRYLAPGFVDHDPPIPGAAGAGGIRRAAAMFREALPDWRSEVTRLVAEGDIVVEQFVAQGTHRGALMGADPPAGRSYWPGSTSSASTATGSSRGGAGSTMPVCCASWV